eukprot:25566_1
MDDMSSIAHLITTLGYAIQEMNQYLDTNGTTINKAINTKTTNCRNEMVSTLSYYQTYIQSRQHTQNTHDDMTHSYPLHQGLEFESTAYNSSPENTANNAKAIALDVVGHIIGTPGPLITEESIPQERDPSPPPPIANSQKDIDIDMEHQHKMKSTLNAYAQPYESQPSPYTNHQAIALPLAQTTPANLHSPRYIPQSLTSPSINSISSPMQTYLMHQFQSNNGWQATQDATYPSHNSHLSSQNRMAQSKQEGVEDAKELEHHEEEEEEAMHHEDGIDAMRREEEEAALNYMMMDQQNRSIGIDDMEEMIEHGEQSNGMRKKQPTNKTNATRPKTTNKSSAKPPLWSAIAKQVAKAPMVTHSTKTNTTNEDEKSPEVMSNEYKRYHANNNTNYWNKRHSNHYSSERSSASSHSSSSSSNHHNIGTTTTTNTTTTTQSSNRTPSPTPPENAHNPHHNTMTNNHRNMNNYHRRSNNNHTKHVQNGKNNGNERCRVFVSNLPPNVTDAEIRNAFSHCGEISNTVWFPSRTDGKFYGSGLITFCDGMGSKEALKMNQQNVLGRIIRCEYSSGQDPVKVKPPGCRTIYLNNVPRDAHESRIRQVFKHCGKIKRVRFHERDTKRTGGAFVEFENT